MIFGAILAGGIGSRMNISDMPKQFLPLGDKPIIIHTIDKFLMCNRFDKIYVGVHSNWVLHTKDLLKSYDIDEEKVVITEGGADRNGTIFNIINKIEEDHGESSDHIIVTHDSVRPFVTLSIINNNIDAAISHGACDTVVNAIDTIVVSQDNNVISNIPDRKIMYQGQTPQSFNMSMLKRLYNDLSEDEKAVLTDACKICVVRDVPVKLVEGEISNIKITTLSDYKIAEAMMSRSMKNLF